MNTEPTIAHSTLSPSEIAGPDLTAYGGVAGGIPGAHHERLDFIDGMRALAALFVVLCHSYFEPANGYYQQRYMNHLGLTYGHLAVDVFIVLSGFCLTLPTVKRGLQLKSMDDFYRQRARRILPPYYAALTLTLVYIVLFAHRATGTVWDSVLPVTPQRVLCNLFLVQNVASNAISYPLWTIATEVQIYLLMPLVLISMRRLGDSATAAISVGIGILLHFAGRGALDNAAPWYIGLFVFGAIAARKAMGIEAARAQRYKLLAAATAIPAILVILLKGKDFFNAHTWFLDTIIGAAVALFMVSAMADAREARSDTGIVRILSWRPLVTVGVFSYSVYLMHAPLLHMLDRLYTWLFHPGAVEMFLLLAASIPLIVLVSYAFHLCFEKPFMRRSKASKELIRRAA